MSEHTPGPWHMQLTDHRRIRSAHENEAVCWVYSGNKFRADSAVLADANLIAAAPDLLAACKVALRLMREHGHTHESPKQQPDYDILGQFDTGLSSPLSAVLEAAIAKAEGGAA